MRIFAFAIGVATALGCDHAPNTTPPAASTTASVSSTESTATTAPATTTASTAPSASTTSAPTSPPLFTYLEGTDALSFWPPTTLRLVRSGAAPKTCMSELSTGRDNMWTGPDVEHAFADADVQAAIKRGPKQSFLPDLGDSGVIVEATLTTSTTSIEWKLASCRWCVAPPKGITNLHQVLGGVMMNRRLLCP